MDLDRSELAWAAGFFDGEGTFCLFACNKKKGKTYWNQKLEISQCERTTLERFMRAVGGIGKIVGPYYRPNPRWKPVWKFRCYKFEHAQAAMAMLWPFLSNPKREQAIRVFGHVGTFARRTKMGKGELQYNDPRVPPSVTDGRKGGVGEAGGQTDILESGFKGAAGPLPGKNDVSASVNEKISTAVKAGT